MIAFRLGDKVVLNSGGPLMTIAGIVGEDILCVMVPESLKLDTVHRPMQDGNIQASDCAHILEGEANHAS